MNSECGSDQRTSGIESYMWSRRLWRSVSQRRMPRETEKHKQKIFLPEQCWDQMQRRQWKRNERRSWRRHSKSKGKESPLCCIDGHPPHSKVRVHPWAFARAISNVEIMKIKIGTIIDEVVGGCHQWKVARMSSKSSSSTSTIIEYFGLSSLNFDKSWIMNYGSSLRGKEETSIICLANLHSLSWNITSKAHKIEQRWNEDESSSVYRKTTIRVKPGLLEKQQRQRRQQQSYVSTTENKVQPQKRKGSFVRTEFGP